MREDERIGRHVSKTHLRRARDQTPGAQRLFIGIEARLDMPRNGRDHPSARSRLRMREGVRHEGIERIRIHADRAR